MPHIQLQKSSPANTATWFMDDTRPINIGVSREPSSVVMNSDTPATAAAMPIVPNCRNPTAESPAVTSSGP